jgi:hypothetical protein
MAATNRQEATTSVQITGHSRSVRCDLAKLPIIYNIVEQDDDSLTFSAGATLDGDGASSPSIHYQLFPGTAAVVNGVTYPLQHG